MKHNFYLQPWAVAALVLIGNLAAFCQEKPATITVELEDVPEGSLRRLNKEILRSINLSSTKPTGVKKGPLDESAIYGVLPVLVSKDGMLVAITESAVGKTGKIYLDANGDGDLTNDPMVKWEELGVPAFGGMAKVAANKLPVTIRFFRYTPSFYQVGPNVNKKPPNRPLYYSREDAREGKAVLGRETYSVLLNECGVTGRYDAVKHEGKQPTVALFIDRNQNDRFEMKFEMYDLSQPFTIAGKTYELDSVAADGSRLALRPAATSVPEVPIPLSMIGQSAIPFQNRSLEGKLVRFPDDYRGKIVLLDFWSNDCAPCLRAKPDLARAFVRHQERGFEVLGVCLDQADNAKQVGDVCRELKMTWPQVYEGEVLGWRHCPAVRRHRFTQCVSGGWHHGQAARDPGGSPPGRRGGHHQQSTGDSRCLAGERACGEWPQVICQHSHFREFPYSTPISSQALRLLFIVL
jgi:hypothetical protein